MNNIERSSIIQSASKRLFDAYQNHSVAAPIRDLVGENDFALAYEVQRAMSDLIMKEGNHHQIGRKLAATTLEGQKALNIPHPAFGKLLNNMELHHNSEVDYHLLYQPKIEVEMAFIMKKSITSPVSMAELMQAIDWVAPAIEIVGSRVNWDIKITDMIADMMCASHFLIGHHIKRLHQVDLVNCQMSLHKNDELFAQGSGHVCLGSPLNALHWLANESVKQDMPIESGETIISGALSPPQSINTNERFSAHITGLGNVNISLV